MILDDVSHQMNPHHRTNHQSDEMGSQHPFQSSEFFKAQMMCDEARRSELFGPEVVGDVCSIQESMRACSLSPSPDAIKDTLRVRGDNNIQMVNTDGVQYASAVPKRQAISEKTYRHNLWHDCLYDCAEGDVCPTDLSPSYDNDIKTGNVDATNSLTTATTTSTKTKTTLPAKPKTTTHRRERSPSRPGKRQRRSRFGFLISDSEFDAEFLAEIERDLKARFVREGSPPPPSLPRQEVGKSGYLTPPEMRGGAAAPTIPTIVVGEYANRYPEFVAKARGRSRTPRCVSKCFDPMAGGTICPQLRSMENTVEGAVPTIEQPQSLNDEDEDVEMEDYPAEDNEEQDNSLDYVPLTELGRMDNSMRALFEVGDDEEIEEVLDALSYNSVVEQVKKEMEMYRDLEGSLEDNDDCSMVDVYQEMEGLEDKEKEVDEKALGSGSKANRKRKSAAGAADFDGKEDEMTVAERLKRRKTREEERVEVDWRRYL